MNSKNKQRRAVHCYTLFFVDACVTIFHVEACSNEANTQLVHCVLFCNKEILMKKTLIAFAVLAMAAASFTAGAAGLPALQGADSGAQRQ